MSHRYFSTSPRNSKENLSKIAVDPLGVDWSELGILRPKRDWSVPSDTTHLSLVDGGGRTFRIKIKIRRIHLAPRVCLKPLLH